MLDARGRRLVQQPHRRRLHQHQRHRAACSRTARSGNPPITPLEPRATRRSATALAAACADLARQMAADAEGATKLAHHRRARRTFGGRGAHALRAPSRAASSCSARSTATTRTGAACSPSSARAARASIPSASTSSYQGVHRVPRRHRRAARRDRAGAARCSQRDIAIDCDLHAGTGEATVTLHRPHPRVRRREHGHVVTRRVDASERPWAGYPRPQRATPW